ncbi:MAG TPA: serine hydrolase [Chloroflexota bacterium]|nr:serine hydrolase [Chloroflexota bacterium]
MDARFAALGDALRAGMARYHVPGVALGVIDRGAEHVAGFGLTSVEHPLPVDGETLFQIASITKTLVATAVMRLVERGQLGLDQPVRRYLPELRLRDARSTDRLTMTHLLTHTGGFQGDVRDGAYGVRCGPGDDALARFVGMVAHMPQHAPPGEVWAYNNAGFSLAGRVIEVVAGQTFEAAIRDLVLEPLGMRRSFFSAAEAITHRVAIGHAVKDGRAEVVRRWALPRVLNPAGGLVCPASDMLRYARFHLGDGGVAGGQRLLSPASMALMRTPRVGDALHNGCLASFADDVGLSWFSRATEHGRLLVHGGWTSLALRLTLVPQQRFGVFVLTNADTGAQLHAEVTKQALRDYAGIDGLDVAPLATPPADPASYAGTYRFAGPDDDDVEVRVNGDRLTLPEWGDAAFYAPDRIVALEGIWRHERGQFLRGTNGQIACLRMGGRLGRRLS